MTHALDPSLAFLPVDAARAERKCLWGPAQASAWLDTAGAGQWEVGPNSSVTSRDYGSAVMYEPGKVLIVGGGAPVNTAEVIDLNVANPPWKRTGSMAFRRRQMNATILADGTVLATGGSSGSGFNNTNTPVYDAELWNPATGKWTTMAKASVIRVYHSTSVLLPDATVLNAGGGLPPWGDPPPQPKPGAPPGTSYERQGRFRTARRFIRRRTCSKVRGQRSRARRRASRMARRSPCPRPMRRIS